jgi:adenylyltransferase/sulfurtransferase
VDAITTALRRIQELERQLQEKEKEISRNNIVWEQKVQRQQQTLDVLEKELYLAKGKDATDSANANANAKHDTTSPSPNPIHIDGIDKQFAKDIIEATLSPDHIARYSRQILVTEGWGVTGQQKLLSSRVLVIGAGGIGSTLLLYLASSGVGHITVVDFDHVEMSNLHRQVIHTNDGAGTGAGAGVGRGIGINKAISACEAMKRLNPTICCTAVTEMITFENALELVDDHDCVVDACDNPQTRYLINDACILSNTPLVSGSAMGVEGQLTVYGYKDSACYRCLYPKINPTEGSKSCSDNGVLGPVPGLIGVLEAIETLKVLTGAGDTMHDRLLMYDSLRCSFLSIKKGKKRSNCAVCGPHASITSMDHSKAVSSSARGPQQCGLVPVNCITPEVNKSCMEYYQLLKDNTDHVLLDVRVQRQYELCALKGAVNIELGSLKDKINIEQIEALSNSGSKPIYCLCRRGIASAEAVRILSERLPSQYSVYNIKGGLNTWMSDIDPSFPMY